MAGIVVVLAVTAYFLVAYPERCMVEVARAMNSVHDMKALDEAARLYQNESGHPPTTLGELVPKFLRRMHSDPWGNQYQYFADGVSFKIWSLGADGAVGGTGSDADLTAEAPTEEVISSVQGLFSCK
jgi:general secretion pathway protein G